MGGNAVLTLSRAPVWELNDHSDSCGVRYRNASRALKLHPVEQTAVETAAKKEFEEAATTWLWRASVSQTAPGSGVGFYRLPQAGLATASDMGRR